MFSLKLSAQHLHGPHSIDKDPNPASPIELFSFGALLNPPDPYNEVGGLKYITHPTKIKNVKHRDFYQYNTTEQRKIVYFSGMHVHVVENPEPLTILGAGVGLGFIGLFGKIASKRKKKHSTEDRL